MADRVYEDIRRAIVQGELKPGERITEEVLADRFGASRTPVRSAIVRLASDGFVDMTPHSGTAVKSRARHEIAEIYDVRAMLESFAARLAAERHEEHHLARLDGIQSELEELSAAARRGEREDAVDALSSLNLGFHQAILDAAGNPTLKDSANRLMDIGFLINTYASFDASEIDRSVSDHRKLLTAIRSRDGAWAEALMRAHILGARNSLIDHPPRH
ncbi:GntR family transcriptional regulator [Acuticoccus yangtzensis]|uniref:GntR family transcriptional regulator n=1 Tax=Acuticoccus yangtzensis TaxID=1443441 RepID=UPI00094956CA|nr:GntR family transcriptional regulator [Acuticoccus yangtzensis]ORE93502.1 transcriptional regulator [Stappia sp. 22II-S9-Z10]